MNYTHQPKSILDQISLLQNRGLIIKDVKLASEQLSNISYFRLASYLRYFESDTQNHIYNIGTTIEQALSLYEFDRNIRTLIFSAIQDIEIALRTKIIQHFSSTHGAFWFLDAAKFSDISIYQHCMDNLRKELSRSNEDFLAEHRQKYDNPPYPPVWKTLEVASFGTLSNLYSNFCDTAVKKQVALDFGLPHYKFLESWIQSITVLRNSCAHHARVWNRRFAVKPKMPATLPKAWISPYMGQPIKLYPQLCCLAYLDKTIIPNSSFTSTLLMLLKSTKDLNYHAMGFPQNWESEPLWK